MILFEYLTVAVSIVLALGLVHLIHGLRVASNPATRYWVHLGYVVIFIVLYLLYWWVLWGFQAGVDWNFGRFLYIFIGPMLLYSLASTLVPDNPTSVMSWRDHFYQIHRTFFLIWAGFVLHQAFSTILVQDTPNAPGMPLLFVAAFTMLFVGAYSKSPRVHSLLLGVILLTFLASIAITFRPVVR